MQFFSILKNHVAITKFTSLIYKVDHCWPVSFPDTFKKFLFSK